MFSHLPTAQAHAFSASFTTLDLTKTQTKMTYAIDELSVMELTQGDKNHNGMLDEAEFESIKSKFESLLKEHLIVKINGEQQDWSDPMKWSFDRKGEATQLKLVVKFPALFSFSVHLIIDNLYQNDSKTNYVNLVTINYGDQHSTAALSGNERTWSMLLSENEYSSFSSKNTNSHSKPSKTH